MESFRTIQAEIKRHLTQQSLEEMSLNFRAINSNVERVIFALNILEQHNLLPDVIRVDKCDIKSEERRNYGNHVFIKLKKDYDALKHYNKAVAYAKSEEKLALAYGNRSAVYFQNKLYHNCIQDINNALNLKFPAHLRPKLMERKKRAEIQTHLLIEDYHTLIPKLLNINEGIECASNQIEIQNSDKLGRHIIAVKDIKPGDVIAIEPSFTNVLLYNNYLTHCNNCLKPSFNLIPCKNCPLTLYCSEKCREIAWELFHQWECVILDTLHSIETTKLLLLALRIVILIRKQLISLNFEPSRIYKTANYTEVHNLITNEEHRNVSDIYARATVAAILLHLLGKTSFFDCFDDVKKARENCGELLLKHLQIAPSNTHESNEIQGNSKSGYEITEIGAGVYGFLSLLNHSCDPNVMRHCYGTVLVLRALKSIKTGEQLLDNYGYHFALMDKNERKLHLKDQYLFNCECVACINDYPLYSEISAGKTNFVVSKDELNDLLKGNRDTAHKLIPILLNNAREFEANPKERFLELLDNQEILKQCYTVLGNKNTTF